MVTVKIVKNILILFIINYNFSSKMSFYNDLNRVFFKIFQTTTLNLYDKTSVYLLT